MIRRNGLLFDHLPDGQFDEMLGISTGAATIFGVTGGVMEAALRTVAVKLAGTGMQVDFHEVRGLEGVKEAGYCLPGRTVRVAVASGLANAKKLLDRVKSGQAQYDFIEIMGCPGGCINGGGQPSQPAEVRNFTDVVKLRASALYQQDSGTKLRRSHENPVVTQVYQEYLGQPGGHKAHEILHTRYIPTKKYRTES